MYTHTMHRSMRLSFAFIFLGWIALLTGTILATVAGAQGVIDTLFWAGIGVNYGGIAFQLIGVIIWCCAVSQAARAAAYAQAAPMYNQVQGQSQQAYARMPPAQAQRRF